MVIFASPVAARHFGDDKRSEMASRLAHCCRRRGRPAATMPAVARRRRRWTAGRPPAYHRHREFAIIITAGPPIIDADGSTPPKGRLNGRRGRQEARFRKHFSKAPASARTDSSRRLMRQGLMGFLATPRSRERTEGLLAARTIHAGR